MQIETSIINFITRQIFGIGFKSHSQKYSFYSDNVYATLVGKFYLLHLYLWL